MLTARDSADIHGLIIQVLLDSLSESFDRTLPVWMTPVHHYDTAASRLRTIPYGEGEWSLLEAAWPTIRRVDSVQDAFQCAAGVQVALPGRACPVREGGVVLALGGFRITGDTLRTDGFLAQSSTARGTLVAWGAGFSEIVLLRDEGRWRLVAAGGRFIT
jgi:hypothetical protein